MKDLSLETLTAFVDGELDDTTHRAVEEAMLRDSAIRSTVDQLRASRGALRDAFAGMVDAPVPARLLNTLTADTRAPQPANIIPLRTPGRARQHWTPLALAASVSLTVGVLVGLMVADGERVAPPENSASLLQRSLETLPSGSSLSAADGSVTITSRASFRAQDGRICREFERQASDARSSGVACRDAQDAQWHTQVEITTASSLSGGASGGGGHVYAPASGALDPLAWVFDQLGAGPALDANEEARLIDGHWQD